MAQIEMIVAGEQNFRKLVVEKFPISYLLLLNLAIK